MKYESTFCDELLRRNSVRRKITEINRCKFDENQGESEEYYVNYITYDMKPAIGNAVMNFLHS